MTVSEKEIKERDLDIQAQQYQKLFYESPAGMLLLDSDGIVIKANQAILDITGYEFDEVVGKRIFDLFVEKGHIPEAKEHVKKIISGEDLQHITKTRHKSGEIYYSLLKETRIKLNDGSYGILSMLMLQILKNKKKK